jgi:hypothetical protein
VDVDRGQVRPQEANLCDLAGLMALFEKPLKGLSVKFLNVGSPGSALSAHIGEVGIFGEH